MSGYGRRGYGSPDTGARYFARDGAVFARTLNGRPVEAGTALSANGRELDRHDRALAIAKAQRAQLHKAAPAADEQHCATCGARIKRVPGGQGSTWVHADSGAVAAPNPPRSDT